MERLLADAEKFSGVKYDINNLDDVYNAIHVVQQEMDITGTTSKEAASTISGSLGMWKASYKDLISNLALGNDIYPQLEALAQSSVAVIKNVLPAIGNIITGIPKMVIDHWPDIKASISSAVGKASDFMKTKWPAFRDAVLNFLVKAGATIVKNIPMIIGKVRQLITKLVAWLPQNSGKVWGAVKKLIGVIIRNLPTILKSLFKLAVTLVKSGIKLAWSAAKGIFKTILSGVGAFAKSVISKIKSGLSNLASTMAKPFTSAKEKVKGIIDKVKGFFPLKFGKFFDNIKLPHFKVSGEFPYGLGGKGQAPGFSVDWYKKAENQPYMFHRATLFGAGERNDEILYGRKQLLEDIADASGNSIVINLNYDAGTDAQEMVSDIARGLKRYRMAGVF